MASSFVRILAVAMAGTMLLPLAARGMSAKDYSPVEKLIGEGKYEEAAERLRKLVEKEPGEKIYWRALGFSLERTWDFAGAAEAYEKSLESGDDSPDTYARLGVSYQRMNRFEDAVKMYRKALSLQLRLDGRIIVLAGIAESSLRLGDKEDYAKYLEQLRELSGKRAGLIEAHVLRTGKRNKQAEDILSHLSFKFLDDPLISYEYALLLIDMQKDLFYAAKLLDSIKPNHELRQLDIDLARLGLAIAEKDPVAIKRLREKLGAAEGLTPDEETYRKSLFDKIEKQF